jgi:toluene monooxygenase electron transfer component
MHIPRHAMRLSDSELSFTCAEDDTVLRAALRAGLGFPYECNVGSCGNCKFELIDGTIKTDWGNAPGLTEKDRERNRFLGCQSHPLGDCTIKLRPIDRYVPPHRPVRAQATLLAKRYITHDIAEFHFDLDQPMVFEPGQYALMGLPGVTGVRAYSMSNIADDGRHLEFQVRRVPTGQGSTVLFDILNPGDIIDLDGPFGMAWLRRDVPREILCIAGGSGLAPMISIARGAVTEPMLDEVQLHFLYGGRTPLDICGENILRALPGWGTRLHYHAAVSAPLENDGAPGPYRVGFVHEMAQQMFGERLAQMEIYFAGPPAMAAAIQRMLLDANVPGEQMHFDQFY